MIPDPDPSDSLREMLTEDVAHLPSMAAQAAREHRARQARHRRQLTQAVCLALLGVCTWQTFHWLRSTPEGNGLAQSKVTKLSSARLENRVLAQTTEETVSKALPPPPGLTQEQRELLESARGLPLLLVMDAPGKPAQIVVVER